MRRILIHDWRNQSNKTEGRQRNMENISYFFLIAGGKHCEDTLPPFSFPIGARINFPPLNKHNKVYFLSILFYFFVTATGKQHLNALQLPPASE